MATHTYNAARVTLTDAEGREITLDGPADLTYKPPFDSPWPQHYIGVDHGSGPDAAGYTVVHFDEPPPGGDGPVQRIDDIGTFTVHTTGPSMARWLKRFMCPEKYRRDLRRRATRKRGNARKRRRGWR